MPQRKRIDPKEQFSKWLAKSGSIYWIMFHTMLLVLMYLQPSIATACVYLSIVVSIVMIIHVWAYTKNSVYEKGLLAMLDKVQMELSLSHTGEANEVIKPQGNDETSKTNNTEDEEEIIHDD